MQTPTLWRLLTLNAHDYLSQAYRIRQRIALQRTRVAEMTELAYGISAAGCEPVSGGAAPSEAAFADTLIRLMEYRDELEDELNRLIDLSREVDMVLSRVEDVDLRLVLTYHYLYSLPNTRIAKELFVSEATVRRWHEEALAQVRVPGSAPRSDEDDEFCEPHT